MQLSLTWDAVKLDILWMHVSWSGLFEFDDLQSDLRR